MAADGVQFNNSRSIVSQHANVSTRLLNYVTVGNKFVRIFSIFKLIATVTLEMQEKVSTVSLTNGNSSKN